MEIEGFNANKDELIHNKYENEINIFIEIKEKDINQKVYFLNDIILKELSQANSTINIDNKEYLFNNYFIPKKKGHILLH